MSWRDWLPWERTQTPAEERALTLGQLPYLAQLLSMDTTGVYVTERMALNISAYWNGVDVISSQVASLPRLVYRRTANESRERANGYPAYKVMHDAPNDYMTPFVFWQTLMAHVLTWGNAYAEIEWDQALRPKALWPILPSEINPEMQKGELIYVYKGHASNFDGMAQPGPELKPGKTIKPEDIIHVPGLGYDGIRGYSVVSMARRSLGLSIATETFGASFFGNGAWPGIVLEHPKTLSLQAQERLIATFEQRSRTAQNAHRTHVLEEGMKASKIGIPPDDAQFLQTREFQIVEIARWLNIPPHKLKHKYGERPGGNLEAGQIEFLTDTLGPWLVRIEQECTRKLIPDSQRGTYYIEHLSDAVLRMSAETRAAIYKTYVDMGVMTLDYVAQKENLPPPPPKKEPPPMPPPPSPIPPPAPQETPPPSEPAADSGTAASSSDRMAATLRALCIAQVARFTRREADKAQKAVGGTVKGFAAWVAQFYSRQSAAILESYLVHPIALQLIPQGREVDVPLVARRLAEEYIERSRRELLALLGEPHGRLIALVERTMEDWEANRPAQLADKIAALGPQEETSHAA